MRFECRRRRISLFHSALPLSSGISFSHFANIGNVYRIYDQTCAVFGTIDFSRRHLEVEFIQCERADLRFTEWLGELGPRTFAYLGRYCKLRISWEPVGKLSGVILRTDDRPEHNTREVRWIRMTGPDMTRPKEQQQDTRTNKRHVDGWRLQSFLNFDVYLLSMSTSLSHPFSILFHLPRLFHIKIRRKRSRRPYMHHLTLPSLIHSRLAVFR